MVIEDHWEDKKVYSISFITNDNKQFERCIILPVEFEDTKKIETLIKSKFNRVKKILTIVEWEDALLLK
ncbi:conserved hypothetical protein [Carnobacterium maltaromaticum]|uniref:hypothetical protein n=1 Tax=Carnobacterium maltaromaticum TaxID=2751 RepID=UPI00191BC124|nr:hypothetical protein [Carnobacterium maltaromaticum]CAD5896361.1 conserved hypothetical protein [Carnobacterium maltaromaticum]